MDGLIFNAVAARGMLPLQAVMAFSMVVRITQSSGMIFPRPFAAGSTGAEAAPFCRRDAMPAPCSAKGGPSASTQTMVTYLYNFGVTRLQIGFGSAVGVVLFVICAGFAFGYKRLLMRHD